MDFIQFEDDGDVVNSNASSEVMNYVTMAEENDFNFEEPRVFLNATAPPTRWLPLKEKIQSLCMNGGANLYHSIGGMLYEHVMGLSEFFLDIDRDLIFSNKDWIIREFATSAINYNAVISALEICWITARGTSKARFVVPLVKSCEHLRSLDCLKVSNGKSIEGNCDNVKQVVVLDVYDKADGFKILNYGSSVGFGLAVTRNVLYRSSSPVPFNGEVVGNIIRLEYGSASVLNHIPINYGLIRGEEKKLLFLEAKRPLNVLSTKGEGIILITDDGEKKLKNCRTIDVMVKSGQMYSFEGSPYGRLPCPDGIAEVCYESGKYTLVKIRHDKSVPQSNLEIAAILKSPTVADYIAKYGKVVNSIGYVVHSTAHYASEFLLSGDKLCTVRRVCNYFFKHNVYISYESAVDVVVMLTGSISTGVVTHSPPANLGRYCSSMELCSGPLISVYENHKNEMKLIADLNNASVHHAHYCAVRSYLGSSSANDDRRKCVRVALGLILAGIYHGRTKESSYDKLDEEEIEYRESGNCSEYGDVLVSAYLLGLHTGATQLEYSHVHDVIRFVSRPSMRAYVDEKSKRLVDKRCVFNSCVGYHNYLPGTDDIITLVLKTLTAIGKSKDDIMMAVDSGQGWVSRDSIEAALSAIRKNKSAKFVLNGGHYFYFNLG